MFLLKAGGEKERVTCPVFKPHTEFYLVKEAGPSIQRLDAGANDDDCEAPLEQLKGGRSFKTHC